MAGFGAPKGNQFAVKDKRWRMAIDRALENKSRAMGVQALDAIAEQMISVALGEDETADVKDKLAVWREIADRLDGKPKQEVDANLGATDGLIDLLSRRRADKTGE